MKRFRKLPCMMISLALLTGCTPSVSILEIQKPEADLTEKTLDSDTAYYLVAEVPESWGKKGELFVAPSTDSSGEAIISVIQWNTPALQETYQEQVDLLFQHDYEAYEDVCNDLHGDYETIQGIQAYQYQGREIIEVQSLNTKQDAILYRTLYRKDIPYCVAVMEATDESFLEAARWAAVTMSEKMIPPSFEPAESFHE